MSLISTAKYRSTESVYHCHWHTWVHWVTERDLNPLSPTVIDLADIFFGLGPRKEIQSSDSEKSSDDYFQYT